MIVRDIPLIPLQQALFSLIKNNQTMAIYGDVPKTAQLPYITIGGITAKIIGVKDIGIWAMSIAVDVWGRPENKQKVNEAINDISTIITFNAEKMVISGYEVIAADIDLAECFPAEDGGYHGQLTAIIKLNKKG